MKFTFLYLTRRKVLFKSADVSITQRTSRYNGAEFHQCNICITDFRQKKKTFGPPPTSSVSSHKKGPS